MTSGLKLHGSILDDANAQMFRVFGATKIVEGASQAYRRHYRAIMEGRFNQELVAVKEAGDARWIVDFCKYVGRTKVYCTRQNIEL